MAESEKTELIEGGSENADAGEAEKPWKTELTVTVKMTTGALYDYMLRHAYTSAAGLLGSCFGAAGILLYLKRGLLIYLVMGVVLLLYLPVSLWMKSVTQMKLNPVFQKPLRYDIGPDGIRVMQGEASQTLSWGQCTKAVSTGKSILLYSGKNNASIFPRKDLGGDAGTLIAVLSKYMEPKKMKVRF